MEFIWFDYNPDTMEYVEYWLDEYAVKMTGMDEGFRDFYEYWSNEEGFFVGKNFWSKVVFYSNEPFAVVAFCLYDNKISIMEIFVSPEKRGLGFGTRLIRELVDNGKTIFCFDVLLSEATIFPSNKASIRAFEKAGFIPFHIHEDGDAIDYVLSK